jgi:hypothetical protein
LSYLLGFWLPLAGLAVLVFLLNQLQYRADNKISKKTRDSKDKQNATDENGENIDKPSRNLVADAIHTYREHRDAQESYRAKRERLNINVLIVTAIFAVVAAIAAGVSAWIFSGQLDETRAESHLSERAFLNVEQLKVDKVGVFAPDKLIPEEDIDWQFSPIFENSGKTPAVNIRVAAVTPITAPSFYGVDQIEMVPGTHNMNPISNRDFKRNAPDDPDIMFSWPADKIQPFLVRSFAYLGPNKAIIPPPAVFHVFRVRQFQMWPWWFYFGSIHYDDFFGDPHISKFCFQVDPAAMDGLGKPAYWVSITPCAHWNCMDDSCKKDRADFDAEDAGTKTEESAAPQKGEKR